MSTLAPERRHQLHARAVRLEWFTVSWNVIEAVVAIGAGIIAGSVALIGFGVDSGIEVISAVALLWRLRKAGPDTETAEETAAERRALWWRPRSFYWLHTSLTRPAAPCWNARNR